MIRRHRNELHFFLHRVYHNYILAVMLLLLSHLLPSCFLLPPPLSRPSARNMFLPRMALRMPEDENSVEALIQQTARLSSSPLLVLHYTDPGANQPAAWEAAPSWGDDDGGYGASSPLDSVVSLVATTYDDSQQYGGRPLTVLQIDRDQPGMDVICSKRGIVTFPTLQIWSRGMCETVSHGDLEQRLLSLGVASKSRPAGGEQRGGVTAGFGAGPRAAPAAAAPLGSGDEPDFFGVGSGGGTLSRQGAANAQLREPPRTAKLPTGESGGADAIEEPPPVEALGLDAEEGETTPRASAREAKVENALDVLFSDPIFDEDD